MKWVVRAICDPGAKLSEHFPEWTMDYSVFKRKKMYRREIWTCRPDLFDLDKTEEVNLRLNFAYFRPFKPLYLVKQAFWCVQNICFYCIIVSTMIESI